MTKKQAILLNISGKKPIKAYYVEVDASTLKLDLFNPRFRHKSFKSEKEMEEEIWKEKDTHPLFLSILESKGISEALFLKHDRVVEEGNRRVVCLRKIKEMYADKPEIFPKEGYTKIPAYIFQKDIDPIDLDVFLARLHVTGKKEWDALNQAEHIHRLKEVHNLTFEQISNLIGISKGKIFQKYWAFNETKKFLEKYPDQPINRYSFFEEAYKKINIRAFLNYESNKKEFYNWIVTKKFDKIGAVDIRELSNFIDNKKIFETFKKKGMKAAYIEYISQDEIKEHPSIRLIETLTTTLKNMSRKDLEEILKDKDKINKIKDLLKELNSILNQ